MKANTLVKDMVHIISAAKSDDMSMDEFNSQVQNQREVLNTLLEEAGDLKTEKELLGALDNLQSVNDPDAINVAIRETKGQIDSIMITERHINALKDLYDTYNLYLEDHDAAIPVFRQQIQEFADIVVRLGALDDNADPLRLALMYAVKIVHGEPVKEQQIRTIMDRIIAPEVHLHCSAPQSAELHALIDLVSKICEEGMSVITVEKQINAQMNAKKGQAKVKEAMDAHRRRLAYRQRMQVKKDSNEVIELRVAEKTGAEWDGFRVENVALKTVKKEVKSACREAFDSFDLDGDKTITIEEIIQFLLSVSPEQRPQGLKDINPFQKAKMRKRLKKMDTDNDGTLSFAEFEAWWKSEDRK